MPWTTPITWSDTTTYTAADLNAQLRDNLAWLLAGRRTQGYYAVVYRSTDQSLANNTTANVTFNAEIEDPSGMHSTVTNTDRLTVPAGGDGPWLWCASLTFLADVSGGGVPVGQREIHITHSGGDEIAGNSTPDQGFQLAANFLSCYGVYNMSSGQYARVQAWQNSGISATLVANACFFMGVRL